MAGNSVESEDSSPIGNGPAAAPRERIYLAVPFAQHDEAKALGARWHRTAKAWFVPPGADPQIFARWLPDAPAWIEVAEDPHVQFAAALREAGLMLKDLPLMDDKLHRVPAEGDRRGETSGAYIGHLDRRPAGFIQNFRTGLKTTWKAGRSDVPIDERALASLRAQAAQSHDQRAREWARRAAQVAEECAAVFEQALSVPPDYAYLLRKRVGAYGVRLGADGQGIDYAGDDGEPRRFDLAGRLLVPVRDERGRITTLQTIAKDGQKLFVPGGTMSGRFFTIGDPNAEARSDLIIAEGYSTAATLHELTQLPVIAALSAGNLLPVARIIRTLYPERPIRIGGDNDHLREAERDLFGRPKPNVGRAKAEEAAAAVGGCARLPPFAAAERGSDWNDFVNMHGHAAALRIWNETRDPGSTALQASFHRPACSPTP